MSTGRAGQGLWAACTLGLLVFVTFWTHQMTGPEGALIRFFDAVQARQPGQVAAAVGGTGSPASDIVAGTVSSELARGARFTAVEIRRERGSARALVRIDYPRGTQFAMFALASRRGRWHVDAEGTAMLFGVPVL